MSGPTPSGSNVVQAPSTRVESATSPEEAAAHAYSPMDREVIRSWTATSVVGSASTVRDELLELIRRTGADELMITTNVHDPATRRESYRLVAEAMLGAAVSRR